MDGCVCVLIKEQFVEVGESQWHLKKHRCYQQNKKQNPGVSTKRRPCHNERTHKKATMQHWCLKKEPFMKKQAMMQHWHLKKEPMKKNL